MNKQDRDASKHYIDFFIALLLSVVVFLLASTRNNSFYNTLPDYVPEGENEFIPMQGGNVELDAVSGIIVSGGVFVQDFSISNNVDNLNSISAKIYLGDGTLLYESPELMPGDFIENIVLGFELDSGRYMNAVLIYDCFDIETHNIVGRYEFPIEIQSIGGKG